MNDRRRAKMKISLFSLKEALHFPSDAEIIGIEQVGKDSVEMFVSCPSFPEVLPGQESPLINPVYRQYSSLVELIDWGFPKEEKKNFCLSGREIMHKCTASDHTLCKGYVEYMANFCYFNLNGTCKNHKMW